MYTATVILRSRSLDAFATSSFTGSGFHCNVAPYRVSSSHDRVRAESQRPPAKRARQYVTPCWASRNRSEIGCCRRDRHSLPRRDPAGAGGPIAGLTAGETEFFHLGKEDFEEA